jgi:hypothetical protein
VLLTTSHFQHSAPFVFSQDTSWRKVEVNSNVADDPLLNIV